MPEEFLEAAEKIGEEKTGRVVLLLIGSKRKIPDLIVKLVARIRIGRGKISQNPRCVYDKLEGFGEGDAKHLHG